MKGQEVEIKKEIEELNFKPTNVSIDDMDKLEQRKIMKKITFEKNSCYNLYVWLFNGIPKQIKNDGCCYS